MSPSHRAMLAYAVLSLAVASNECAAVTGLRGSALVKWTSDYTYHGYTKSAHDPSVQIHTAVSHAGGLYAGHWLSHVDLGGAGFELMPYVGFHHRLSAESSCDMAIAAYFFDDRVFGRGANYGEGYARCDWKQWLTGKISYAFDAYGQGHSLPTYELGGRLPLSDVLELDARGGYSQARDLFDYDVVYWNIGMSYFFGAHTVLDVRYVDNRYVNEIGGTGHESPFAALQADEQVNFSISVGF